MSRVLSYLLHYPLHTVVGVLLYIGVCVYAVLRGRPPQRLGGAGLIVNLFAPVMVSNFFDPGSLQVGVLLIDIGLLTFLVITAWRFFERWLIAAAAAQFISVCIHMAKFFDPTIDGRIYITAIIVCSYAVLTALAVALATDRFTPKGA